MAVVPDGRPSVTGYRVRERFADWTLLELDLVTGRTHQIRVHLEAIGHPIAGDPVYGTGTSRRGPDGLDRLFLHAWRLELTSPSDGHLIRATAPLPPELEARPRRAPGGRPLSDAIEPHRAGRAERRRARRDARHHLGPERGRQGHDHRRPPDAVARPGVPLRRDLHDARAATGRGRRRRLPLPDARRRSRRCAPPAASSRRTRSTATGTARHAARSARRSRRAATSSSRSTSRARRSSRARSRARCSSSSSRRRSRTSSSGCAAGRPRRPTSSRSASATPPSSSRARRTTTTS